MPLQKTTAADQAPDKTKALITRLDADPAYAEAAAVLRVLQDGLSAIERDRDSAVVEDHLRRSPSDSHAGALRARLKANRSASPPPAQVAGNSSKSPAAVAEALELLKAGADRRAVLAGISARPARPDHRQVIADLEENAAVIRAGIAAQQRVIDSIRGSASAALADRLRAGHRDLVLKQFRAAQHFAAATDALRQLRSEILAAGFEFRSDVLPEPTSRAALILGSESDWNSEVNGLRRLLEELGIIL
jgi:hypothetical protein